MGFLLREVLRTLCGSNNWCYAVFWKIGCHNPKLLIWEECHYEAMPCSTPRISGVDCSGMPFGEWEGSWASSKGQSSQLGILAGDRIPTLINKMMVDNQINVVGEGIVGRAAFTGKHQWILSNNFVRHAHPPEVSNEVHNQFSAGMQTVAVIPVLPHGVVQLGSPLTVMENIGFVNDVKSLILQLGCVPGALLSDNYAAAKVSAENIRVPVTFGMPVSGNSSGFNEVTNSSTSIPDSFNQQSNISQALRLVGQSSIPPIKQVQDNTLTTASIFHTPDLVHASAKSQDNHFQPIDTSLMKLNLPFNAQLHNGVVGAEVIPSNPDAWLNQQASSCNSRFNFNHQPNNGQSGTSHSSLRVIEQHSFSNAGVQDRSSGNMSASSSCGIIQSQLRTNRGLVLNSQKEPTPLIEGREIPRGIGSHRKPTSTPKPRESADTNLYHEHFAGVRFCNVDPSSKEVVHLSNLAEQSSTSHVISRGFDTMHMPTGSAPRKQIKEDDSLQVLSIPSIIQPNDHSSLTECISDFNTDCQKHESGSRAAIAKYEDVCAQPSSGDDLFDMLGLDYKNKLPNGNFNDLIADEVDANPQNLFKETSVFMNMQDAGSDFYSVSNGISDSGLFSGMGSDHLLDAVVSRAQSLVKQSSDDNVSCGTTLTKISSSSVPSNSPTTGRGNRTYQVQGELFGLPKPILKPGAVGSRSFNGCSRDDPGSCSQTSSIYGSQISSWVEQGHNMKGDPSVSTAFSKKPDDSIKSNRKRLKPGENPRQRPKDRQMIQDRVKELREIVPNGAKCSIDALLERTIKHMLFLQSVTKHADKLKQTGESKIINKEGGLLLKDNFEGGATWAFEVGSQSMVCPIIVEDLNPPRQMLVEMLCEEQGFFLEIADLIRGMGLTILKGVMEARNDKIWARFAVEANRDVTRMEIFMSLVRLLEQTVKGSASSANSIDNNNTMVHSFPQAASIPATGMPSSMQ